MAIGGFPSFVEDMKIFGRERLNGHYGVGAFVVGNTFSSIPYLLMISLIPGVIAYYLVGLHKGFEHFVYFALMLFVCMMLVESLMMIVASIVPDFLMGIITGAGIQGVMMLNGGFFRLPNDLPKPFWRYPMYYIAFHKYANQGFYKNEFQGLTFPNNQAGGPPTITGEEILQNVWQVETGYSKWVDVAILFGMVVLYRLLFLGIIKTVEKVKPMIKGLMVASPEKSKQIIENPPSSPFLHEAKMYLNEVNTYIIYVICKKLNCLAFFQCFFCANSFCLECENTHTASLFLSCSSLPMANPENLALRKGLHQAKCGRFTILGNFIDHVITRIFSGWHQNQSTSFSEEGIKIEIVFELHPTFMCWGPIKQPHHKLQRPILGDKQP
ncbi:unnamed protein product, partial [Vitis vinifera]